MIVDRNVNKADKDTRLHKNGHYIKWYTLWLNWIQITNCQSCYNDNCKLTTWHMILQINNTMWLSYISKADHSLDVWNNKPSFLSVISYHGMFHVRVLQIIKTTTDTDNP